MIIPDEKTLRGIQLIQLEMLKEVDRICRENDIEYTIIAGTMLGAVRHGGYIPWDDDADVAMLRPEYLRFRKICETALDHERFTFQDHVCTPGYRWGYGKLRRKGTQFVREHQEHMPYEQGIFIDIFPLDNVPEPYILRTLKNFECFCVRKILWSKVGKIADRSPLKRTVYRLLDKIPEEKILQYDEGMITRAAKTSSGMVRILMFPTPNREYMYYKRWYTERKEIRFEDGIFYGPKDADGYLSFKFGDYMALPPEKDRKNHPVSVLQLTEPK